MATEMEEIEMTESPVVVNWDTIKAEKVSKFPQLANLVGSNIRIHAMGTEDGRGEKVYKLAHITTLPNVDSESAEWYELPGGIWTKLNNTFARYHGNCRVDATVVKGAKRVILEAYVP